jgi:hypothetical protein
VDKHKIIKKLFVISILVNCYFFYNNFQRYFHLWLINERVLKNRREFLERLNTLNTKKVQ